jgi:ABC-type sugar transport system ATPase subunit
MIYVTHDQVEAMTLGEKIILFNNGIIQQIGTPREVYERPSNLFVATFIGSPRINLIEGRIVVNEGRILFKSSELMIDVGLRKELKEYSGKDITTGIRPESLTPGDGPINGYLELIEHIGSETILYVRSDSTLIIAKAPPDFQEKIGKKISLALNKANIHFFHKGIRVKTDEEGAG